MEKSELCQYGRSKEKRSDCKIVVLAAVVKTVTKKQKFHGKYVLLTSLDESEELNIWKFYNVIRTGARENPCYTQIGLQKIQILEIKELRD